MASRHQHGEEVVAVRFEVVGIRPAVEPDIFLGTVDIAVDGAVLADVLAFTVNRWIIGGKGCPANC